MSAMHYLFGFRGRINRARLWLFVLISFFVQVAISFVDADSAKSLGSASLYPLIQRSGAAGDIGLGLLMLVVGIGLVWADIATTVKRLHDRKKSGWWIIVFKVLPAVCMVAGLIVIGIPLSAMEGGDVAREAIRQTPLQISDTAWAWFFGLFFTGVVLGLWGFIELYCLRGTDGSNRYGVDLLEDGPVFCELGNPVYGCTPKP